MRLNIATLLALLGLLYALYSWLKSANRPTLTLPLSVKLPVEHERTLKMQAHRISVWLFWVAAALLAIALSYPRLVEQNKNPSLAVGKNPIPREGIAIYFLLDESGSMIEKITTVDAHGAPYQIRKIDLAKQVIMEFIDGKKGLGLPGRKDDLVGLIAFARIPQVLCPLTLNHQQIADILKKIVPIQEDARNGTAIGYAIFKAVNIIVATKYFAKRQEEEHKSVYSIKNQAIIIITDGLQSPNPDDKNNPFRFMPPQEALNYAVQNGIRVFYVGIDPILNQSQFASDVSQLRQALQGSGGELFLANATEPVEDILAKIDKMEKSELPPETVFAQVPTQETPIVGLFILLALVSLGAAIVLETTVGRSAP